MLKIYLVLVLFAAAFAESVRETETWMPLKPVESHDDLVSSGDFEFPKESTTFDDDDDDDDEEDLDDSDDLSGSGDEEMINGDEGMQTVAGDFDNHIPESRSTSKPMLNQDDIAVKYNEVGHHSSVQLSHTEEQDIFKKTEVLVAVIAGGAVGLLFAVLLILLLVYRMKKKDEGSYDMGKKPIYKKAPTAEIYA